MVLADDKIVFYEDFITEKYQLTIENIKKVKTDSLVVSPNFSFIIVNMKSRSRRRDQEKYEGSIMFILNKENGKYYQKGMTKKSKKKIHKIKKLVFFEKRDISKNHVFGVGVNENDILMVFCVNLKSGVIEEIEEKRIQSNEVICDIVVMPDHILSVGNNGNYFKLKINYNNN